MIDPIATIIPGMQAYALNYYNVIIKCFIRTPGLWVWVLFNTLLVLCGYFLATFGFGSESELVCEAALCASLLNGIILAVFLIDQLDGGLRGPIIRDTIDRSAAMSPARNVTIALGVGSFCCLAGIPIALAYLVATLSAGHELADWFLAGWAMCCGQVLIITALCQVVAALLGSTAVPWAAVVFFAGGHAWGALDLSAAGGPLGWLTWVLPDLAPLNPTRLPPEEVDWIRALSGVAYALSYAVAVSLLGSFAEQIKNRLR